MMAHQCRLKSLGMLVSLHCGVCLWNNMWAEGGGGGVIGMFIVWRQFLLMKEKPWKFWVMCSFPQFNFHILQLGKERESQEELDSWWSGEALAKESGHVDFTCWVEAASPWRGKTGRHSVLSTWLIAVLIEQCRPSHPEPRPQACLS